MDECHGGPHEIRPVFRSGLLKALEGGVPSGNIHFGVKVAGVESTKDGNPLHACCITLCSTVCSGLLCRCWRCIPKRHGTLFLPRTMALTCSPTSQLYAAWCGRCKRDPGRRPEAGGEGGDWGRRRTQCGWARAESTAADLCRLHSIQVQPTIPNHGHATDNLRVHQHVRLAQHTNVKPRLAC